MELLNSAKSSKCHLIVSTYFYERTKDDQYKHKINNLLINDLIWHHYVSQYKQIEYTIYEYPNLFVTLRNSAYIHPKYCNIVCQSLILNILLTNVSSKTINYHLDLIELLVFLNDSF